MNSIATALCLTVLLVGTGALIAVWTYPKRPKS